MFELVLANSTREEVQEALQATVRNLPPDQRERVARMLQACGADGSGGGRRMGIGGSASVGGCGQQGYGRPGHGQQSGSDPMGGPMR